MFGGRVNERRVPRLKLDHLCQELRSTGGLLAEGADPSFFSHRISSATTAKTSFFHPVGAQIFPTPMADHPPPSDSRHFIHSDWLAVDWNGQSVIISSVHGSGSSTAEERAEAVVVRSPIWWVPCNYPAGLLLSPCSCGRPEQQQNDGFTGIAAITLTRQSA